MNQTFFWCNQSSLKKTFLEPLFTSMFYLKSPRRNHFAPRSFFVHKTCFQKFLIRFKHRCLVLPYHLEAKDRLPISNVIILSPFTNSKRLNARKSVSCKNLFFCFLPCPMLKLTLQKTS